MYKAKLKVSFDSEWTYIGDSFDDGILPEEHYTFEIPVEDINSNQLFRFFGTIARTIGHNELSIMKGAASLAFNEMRSEDDMRIVAEEQDLKLEEDYSKEYREMQDEIYDLKAKLSRALNPDAEQYTEEEMDALCASAERGITVDTLQNASTVCKDCGSKYGTYSVGCSSTWEGKCGVCGETKSVTEVRDYGYLSKGIKELKK